MAEARTYRAVFRSPAVSVFQTLSSAQADEVRAIIDELERDPNANAVPFSFEGDSILKRESARFSIVYVIDSDSAQVDILTIDAN